MSHQPSVVGATLCDMLMQEPISRWRRIARDIVKAIYLDTDLNGPDNNDYLHTIDTGQCFD